MYPELLQELKRLGSFDSGKNLRDGWFFHFFKL